MKYFYKVIFFLSIASTALPMKTTFFGPDLHAEKPRFNRLHLTSIEAGIAYNHASEGYNRNGEHVPLLAYRGVEPLLPQFVDDTVAITTATPLAYGLFDATYKGVGYHVSLIQNINDSFFFGLSSSLCQDKLENITITPTSIKGRHLSDQDLESNPKLTPYLHELRQQVGSRQERSYVGPSYLSIGYTKSMTDFERLDFIDITVQTGFIIPIFKLDEPEQATMIFPRQDIVNVGIPLQLSVAFGVYDWLNIGATGSLVGYIKSDQIVPLNTADAPNKLIIPQSGLCSVYHEPRISLSAYIEGEYFVPNWTWFVGVSYTKQHPTRYEAYDQKKFPTTTIQNYPTQHEWEQAYLTLASEFDLSSHESMVLPRCKFIYSKPVYGRTCFDSRLLAGQIGLEISYDF